MDLYLFHFLNNLAGQSRVFDALIIFLASYLQYFLIFAFFLFLFFDVTIKSEKVRIFLVAAVSVIISRFGTIEFIRFFYHRPRPFMADPNVRHLVFDNSWSFPSGHAAFFFAMATVIYFYNKKWGRGFFIASILITLSRIIAGVHYPSDIIGGAIVGIMIAYAIIKLKIKIWRI